MTFLQKETIKDALNITFIVIFITAYVIASVKTNPKNKLDTHNLFCFTNLGHVQVPKDKVVTFQLDTWIFTNGHAKNCELKPK